MHGTPAAKGVTCIGEYQTYAGRIPYDDMHNTAITILDSSVALYEQLMQAADVDMCEQTCDTSSTPCVMSCAVITTVDLAGKMRGPRNGCTCNRATACKPNGAVHLGQQHLAVLVTHAQAGIHVQS